MKRFILLASCLILIGYAIPAFSQCELQIINHSNQDKTAWFVTEGETGKVRLHWFFIDANQTGSGNIDCGTYWWVGNTDAIDEQRAGCIDSATFELICVKAIHKQIILGDSDWRNHHQKLTVREGEDFRITLTINP